MSDAETRVERSCPDGFYRGCDFMGCEGLLRICPTYPSCPHAALTDGTSDGD